MPFPKRFLLPLALLAVPLVAPAASQGYLLGVSDQQATTFTDPLFAPLKFRAARYIAPYDAMSSARDHQRLDAWLTAARAADQRILVSFEHSLRPGRARRLPSVAEFRREMTKFHRAYPGVKEISPWNEVNRCVARTGPVAGQPTCRKEKRLAQYYATVRKVFGRGTTVVALDILDGQNVASALRTIRNFLRYARPRPKILGFHNYSDTNRFSSSRTRAILRAWRGEVWLTETGGIVNLGRNFRYSPSRAAKALGCMFTLARQNGRIKRLYVYQFNGAPRGSRFDAGLVAHGGTKRPGYDVVKSRRARTCRR